MDALQNIAAAENNKLILMPLEASSVIGALGGIGEIARETMSQDKDKPDRKEQK